MKSSSYYNGAATALVLALEAKSDETGGHAQRVARLAERLGQELRLDDRSMNTLRFGALLHDVGKIAVSDSILKKPGRLTEDEWREMRRHPFLGFDLLLSLDFPGDVALVVAQHHERFDGSGYPNGLGRYCICLEARIFSIVDTYDAITRDRCYRKGASYEIAAKEIADWSGRQFDPEIVEAFLKTPKEAWD